MNVLVVGCGYVGTPLGAELARRGHKVWGVRRSQSAKSGLDAAGIKMVSADITRPETLDSLPRGCDWVVLCVSAGGGAEEDYRKTYVQGAQNLLNWLSSQPPRKFVYTSSTGVYGQSDGSVVDETSPVEPQAETGKVLVEAERVVLDAAGSGLPAVVLRVAGIYGPGRGYWLKQYLAGQAAIEGEGSRILNMIHRDDVAGIACVALERGIPGQVYNAVDNEPISQRALFEWLSRELGRELPPVIPEDATKARTRGVTSKRILNKRIKEELGYHFKYPTFREGFLAEITLLEKRSLQ
jgi:nucleoside-diphosphate-sugar epimerase